MLHMPALFEAFVAEWLRTNLPPEYILSKQFQYQLESEGKEIFRIDLVLSDANTHQALAVLDTKYKRSSAPDEDDIKQAIAYAVSMQTNIAFLVYPSKTTENYAHTFGQSVSVRTLEGLKSESHRE